MQDVMLSDIPVEEREEILRDSCDQIEERSYTRKFDQIETNERRSELAQVSIQLSDLNNRLAEIRAEYKSKIKPLEERKGKILEELKSGGEYVTGKCFKFLDGEDNMAAWYTGEGYKLEERPLRPDEKQRTIFQSLKRTGTDNK